MPPSHRRAIADILACRTEALGGHLERCTACGAEVHRCHSCRNRSCPKCHGEQTRAWLDKRQAEMLPCPYFHVTVTVPEELRAALRRHQRDGYGALMTAAAEAIIELARDPRHVGGTVGVLAVLHTWTQQLHFHPHVHCLVTGGGVGEDGDTWHPARPGFLVPTKALARKVRGRFRAVFEKRCPGVSLPAAVWRTPWVVHITPWGVGEQAVLDYLARYVFRIALTDRRIVGLDDETVTFQYRDRKAGRTADLPGPGARVPASLSPACSAQGLSQGPLLRPVASFPAQPGDPRAPRPAARPPHRTAAQSRTAGCPRSSAIARAWFGDTIATARASMPPVPDRPPRRHRPMDPDAPKGSIAPGHASKPPETGAGASTTGRRRGSTRPRSRICA